MSKTVSPCGKALPRARFERFSIWVFKLKERCPRCWATEVSDLFPQSANRLMAIDALRELGNPKCIQEPKE